MSEMLPYSGICITGTIHSIEIDNMTALSK